MPLEVVHLLLAVVAIDSEDAFCLSNRQLCCNCVAKGRNGEDGCWHHVMVVVAFVEDFVIGLSVVWRERHSE